MVKILIPSLIGIGVCVICFLGTTYAWFTDNISIPIQSIQSADYSLKIVIKDGDSIVNDNDGVYILSPKEQGKGYEVSITATGTAKKGFCIINGNMITPLIENNKILTLTLYPNSDNEKYIFTSMWGTHSTLKDGDSSEYIKIENGIIGTPLQQSDLREVNNIVIPNVEKVEQSNPQPEKTETIIPSEEEIVTPSEEVETITPPEETMEETIEEENKIMENNSSDTDNENYDIP